MERRLPQSIVRLAVLALWVGLLLTALGDVLWVLRQVDVAGDYLAVRGSGSALLHGRSVYADPTFVYPPSAAVVSVPLALSGMTAGYRWWLLISLAAQLAAVPLMQRATGRGPIRWGAPMVLPALVMCGGALALRTLPLGNASLLLVPVAVGVVVAFARGRWTLGCALLAASLLVKPLLLPLLLLPLVARRWRPLALTFVPAGLVLVAAALLVPGGRDIHRYVGYVATGSNLRGSMAPLNLSLGGWAEAHGLPGWAALLARLLVAAVAVSLVVALARRPASPTLMCRLAVIVFATVLLVGRLAESHYLPVLLALVVLRLVVAPSSAAFRYHLPGLALLCLTPSIAPAGWTGPADQNWFVAAELLVFAAAASDAWHARGTARAVPPATRRASRPPMVSGCTTGVPASRLSAQG